jgi:beta-galactosidase
LGTYNLPQWSEFLTSLGGSAHPSWHFGDFDRADYTIAMSANSEILRSGAGKLPWFMTEIQGGNNIYTGGSPLCPTADEIVQWLMTVLFHEGKGGIFWSFNQRSAGIEAAEWGMLDLKGEPTDRVHAASKVAQFIEDNLQILEVAKVDDSNVHLIYNRESLWVESRVVPIKQNMLGRSGRSGIISTQTYYKTLSEIGIAATISEINEFDFSKTSYAGELMIFPNQIALTDEQLELIKSFAEKGGTVLLSGLTGFFDQNAFCRHMATNMLDELVGAELKEVKYLSDSFTLNMEKYQLNSQMVYSILNPISAEPWAYYGKEITGTRNKVGDGEVLWISSPIALEAKVNSNTSLKTLLKDILSQIKVKVPENSGVGLFTKTLVSKELNLTLYINKSNSPQKVKVDSKSEIIFSSCTNEIINDSIKIKPEETVVVKTYLL